MNPLQANAHFSKVPGIDINRSILPISWTHKTTFNSGRLIPVSCVEVLPGDTWQMDLSLLCRMATPIFPVMDNAFLDVYHFFVPNRLLWDHWKEFNGENNVSAWVSSTDYFIPMLNGAPSEGSIADHFGLPTKVGNYSFSALPFRAYRLIYNEWFRDQNLIDPMLVNTGDTETDLSLIGDCLPVAKMHDYFTSALPSPQKGPSTLIPLGALADVVVGSVRSSNLNTNPLISSMTFSSSGSFADGASYPLFLSNRLNANVANLGFDSSDAVDITGGFKGALPSNLYADMSTVTTTINELRKSFAIQRLYERDARGGSRYTEILRAHFGVTAPDASLQRPELLGAKRIPINMSQVVQMSSTDSTSPIGTTSAYSKTTDYGEGFVKSFTEHGYIITVVCVRPQHSYQQGLNRMWSRSSRFDFYWPALANIGEQAVLNKELYMVNTISDLEKYNDGVFGYQEAWADYRYHPSTVSGAFRSNSSRTLDSWHYADNFTSPPYLSEGFINESDVNIGRTLAVQDSEVADQFIIDIAFDCKATRPMPVYSVPGFLDHN